MGVLARGLAYVLLAAGPVWYLHDRGHVDTAPLAAAVDRWVQFSVLYPVWSVLLIGAGSVLVVLPVGLAVMEY